MKARKFLDMLFVRQSARAGLMLVIVAVVTLEATAIVQFVFSQKAIREEATSRAESQLDATRLKILNIVDQTETAVRNGVWLAQWALDAPDSLVAVSRRILETNPNIVGSTIALTPGYNKKHPLYAPYCFRAPGSETITFSSLATEEYDYPSQEWFTKPLALGSGYWSEPYVDVGGGDILMTTYSVPILDRYGRQAAVLTADISLDWLTELVGDVKVYPNAFSMMISREGRIMVCPVDSFVMRYTVGEAAANLGDTVTFSELNRSMLSGQRGNTVLRYNKTMTHVFFAPVEKTGWSMSIMIPDSEIYGNIRRVGLLVKLLQILGIIMLVLILRAFILNQVKYKELDDRKKAVENELQIAHGIQMSMIPKIFPPFPERKDLDMAATIVPAKEVGGDLYDFFIRDEKLFFCIGDVSGKGIPASLVMAVTRSMFRTLSAHEDRPERIVGQMNDSMADSNENNMFVTFLLGVLDLSNGHLAYCNAGHNAPVMLTDKKAPLPVESNIPLGVLTGFEFIGQETKLRDDDAIFLYTDGLTEAENAAHELFGEERMYEVLGTRRRSSEHLEAIKAAVSAFVGDAPQSDDLTMLFIHFFSKRHLTLENDIKEIEKLSAFVEAIGEERGLDPGLVSGINLALEEAATNVIMYAYPKETAGALDVDAVLGLDSLEFTLTDGGVPFDPTAAPEADVTLSAEERGIGGLGIFLVRKIMDSVTYTRRDGKNILTMTKKL